MTETDILRKVRALLDRAEHQATPEPEREACFAKAQELMIRHAIDEGKLQARGQTTTKPTAKRIVYSESRYYIGAKRNLLSNVVRHNRCQVVYHTKRGGNEGQQSATIVGFSDDIGFIEMLYTSLLLQQSRELEQAWKTDGYGDKRNFSNSFIFSFANTVGSRLAEMNRKAEDEVERAEPGTALVLLNRETEVKEAYKDMFPNLKNLSSGSVNWNDGGYYAGKEAGRRADLSGGLGQVKSNRKELK